MSTRCEKPIMIRNSSVTRGGVSVPCGQCANCLARRTSNWSFRLMQEDKVADSSYFLTLTYDNDHCPITKNGFMDLRISDLQKFFKRLRKAHTKNASTLKPLKYYAVGEYGGRFNRPHYHVILFNADLGLIIEQRLADYAKRGLIELKGDEPMGCKLWGYERKVITVYGTRKIRSIIPAVSLGHCTVGQVSGASVGYTMKYVSKPWRPMHRNDDRTAPFSISSNGLGINYLSNEMVKWHTKDLQNRQYCVLQDGKKIPLPRYYKNHMLSLQEKECLRAINVLEGMKDQDKKENTARERSEAFYAGINRFNLSLNKNQKL